MNSIDPHRCDLHALMFDAPILFRKIIDVTIAANDGFGFAPNQVWAYEKEIAAITAAQWEAFGGQSTQAKTNKYDYDVQKIKNDLMWAGIQSADSVEIVFWQDSFDPLVSFARKTKRLTMMNLLDAPYDEMKEAGFSYDFIAKITNVLREWAEKLLNPDEKDFEQEQELLESDIDDDNDDSFDIASDLFSMFFAEEDDDLGGECDGEQSTDTGCA